MKIGLAGRCLEIKPGGTNHMERKYLEQESIKENARRRKLFLGLFIFSVCIFAFLYFAVGDSIDLNKPEDKKLFVIFAVMAGFILFCTAVQLIRAMLPAKNGKNLILPLKENTREAVAEIINREAAEGKILYEGFMNHKTIRKYSDRITILPSYILLIEEIGKITAIPRNKIYWICAQTGYKGGPYYVRLLIFTEKKLIDFDGNDIEHTEEVAENIYRYIPNVFKDYAAQSGIKNFPQVMEKLYKENRAEFVRFYEEEKQKLSQHT